MGKTFFLGIAQKKIQPFLGSCFYAKHVSETYTIELENTDMLNRKIISPRSSIGSLNNIKSLKRYTYECVWYAFKLYLFVLSARKVMREYFVFNIKKVSVVPLLRLLTPLRGFTCVLDYKVIVISRFYLCFVLLSCMTNKFDIFKDFFPAITRHEFHNPQWKGWGIKSKVKFEFISIKNQFRDSNFNNSLNFSEPPSALFNTTTFETPLSIIFAFPVKQMYLNTISPFLH